MRFDSLGNNATAQRSYNLQDPLPIPELEQALTTNRTSGHAPPATTTQASGPSAPEPTPEPNVMAMSPDSVMAYCQARLDSLDSQMTSIMNQQQSNGQLTEDVNDIAGLLNDAGPTSAGSSNVKVNTAEVDAAYAQAISDATTAGDGTLANDLKNDQQNFDSNVQSDGTISATQVSGFVQNLKNYGDGLNSDSEMSMINLQSLMSQRQTAIQLSTQLVQSLGDQSNSIVKNVGQ